MILADTRHHLTRADAQLALHLIARGPEGSLEGAEALLRDRGIDALLDDSRLLAALMSAPQGAYASLPLFAYVVVRHALLSVGEDDRRIADYVSAVFTHFARRGNVDRVAAADDETYDTLAALAEDLDSPDARRAFLVRAHLGNYALWLSGLFPDHIETRRWRRGGPDLGYYEEMGSRGFRLAAGHRLAEQHGLTPLYERAAERFAVLRLALNRVSDRLLFPHVHTPERLMRQVKDEVMFRLS